jgi:uncharacterized membrane protein YciS (DUF1049 family)
MNQSLFQSINPLQEHMINQEKFRKQSILGVFCIGLLLGGIVCFVLFYSLPKTRLKADDRQT